MCEGEERGRAVGKKGGGGLGDAKGEKWGMKGTMVILEETEARRERRWKSVGRLQRSDAR